jgi:CRP/FNR family transcriptional regulator, anaerobic regulatory protein
MATVPIHRLTPEHPQAVACVSCEVRSSALFGALDDASLDRLHTQINPLSLKPDAILYHRGRTGFALYTLREGVVRFERSNERGDRRIIRIAGRGDLIGQESLLQQPYADDAVACTAVELCRIPIALLDPLANAGGALPRELMRRWQKALDASEAWVAELSAGPGRRRVLQLLRRLASYPDPAGLIWLPRREEMGAMLDMTVETASRLVSALRREGVVELVSYRSARLDRDALDRALAREDAN